jgi:hypothetical protein
VAITTEFLLATSEVYSPMANVVTFSANTDAHSLGIQYNTKNILPLDEGVRVINVFPRVLIYPNTFIQGQYVYISICY